MRKLRSMIVIVCLAAVAAVVTGCADDVYQRKTITTEQQDPVQMKSPGDSQYIVE